MQLVCSTDFCTPASAICLNQHQVGRIIHNIQSSGCLLVLQDFANREYTIEVGEMKAPAGRRNCREALTIPVGAVFTGTLCPDKAEPSAEGWLDTYPVGTADEHAALVLRLGDGWLNKLGQGNVFRERQGRHKACWDEVGCKEWTTGTRQGDSNMCAPAWTIFKGEVRQILGNWAR
jgi:hypothetical protein